MANIIEISNLDKSFGEVHAVNDLSFHVKRGELFAFLGVNGAGKSTSKPTLSQYISGKIYPSLPTFAKLCQIIDCSSDDILGLK